MFRAIRCSSSGLFVRAASDIVTLCRWRSGAPDRHLQRVAMSEAARTNRPEDEQHIARNM
jgi:hypothetical protein